MNSINKYAIMAIGMGSMMEVHNNEWKERILKKWEESKNLPRKKKKKERKSLSIEWSIASWSPFDDYFS